ncbi:unnamed protein product [Candidula unifasciata]|uniref:VWFA domain-containing protein n=1 Tax=Candidula unifasciata TaxID=100452 RepID=A0A8S3ZMG2_9EUPU|nr:unnamed protein product [Candidula unifasciata]
MASESHVVVKSDPFVKSMLSMIRSDVGKMNKAETLYTRSETENGDVKYLISSADCQQVWEPDVEPLVSSQIWLQNNGLKKKRLTLHQILPTIGFKFNENESLEKSVSSRYGRQLFSQLMRPDGKTFNISCNKDKLYHLEKNLLQAIYLFKRRIEWLTTESRRTFGVIEEKSVIIVLNFNHVTAQQFNQYMTALESVLRQQVSQISTFNIIRACEDMQLFSPETVSVSCETIESAVKWIWSLDPLAATSQTSTVEAVLKALSDKHTRAVYLYTEGTSVNDGREILKHKVLVTKNSVPVHVVSFNCDCPETITFLREFAESTNGRFHAYAVVMDLDAYETKSGDGTTNRANIILKRKTLDVVLIFEEMEEARSTLEQLRLLREKLPTFSVPINRIDPAQNSTLTEEHFVTSREWLKSNGLNAKGLQWHEIVSRLAFRHTDTVVDLMHPCESQTDAVVKQKLVNACYCDELFPVVKLKDGQVFHVFVTSDIYRSYEEKIHGVIHRIQQRIDWLKAGSRALFGTLVEEHVYILIDTSASMENSLAFVKQKIFVLMQEQLRYKKQFNIIAFNTKAVAWKDRIVDVSEHSLRAAWAWVQSLTCSGSTNTHAAIDMAMGDPQTEAIYLLTDGRPDQPPSTIIFHTISFNCNDTEANTFLYDLAKVTGGRYHCFSQNGHLVDQPQAWESMDIKELKDEISRGIELLHELARLRDESSRLSWKKGATDLRRRLNRGRHYHTKTSSGRFTPNEWMLPETKVLFQKQAEKRRADSDKHSSRRLLQSQFTKSSKPSVTSSVTESVAVANQSSEKGKTLSSKQWLAKHGLAAKHLTIMDALGSTFVSHKPKYVSVLDKYISGKVFNEIMPMAFVSSDQRMYFFNPDGINLKEYENSVRAAMDKFRKRLNTIVWEALPPSSRKEFDSTEPFLFENNKEKMLQLLQEADWPVAEMDVCLLLDEIAKGEKYFNQSRVLRRAPVSGNAHTDRKEKTSASNSSSESSHRSRSSSSVSSRHNSQPSGENSPRRLRSRSLSSHDAHSNPENVSSAKREISSSKAMSRSSSSSSNRSHSSPTSRSKSPGQTASPIPVNSSRRSTSNSPSESSSKQLTIHRGRAMKTDVTSATVEKNLQRQSKSISHSSGNQQLKKPNTKSSSSSALKSQLVSSSKDGKHQNTARHLSARERLKTSRKRSQTYREHVHKQISISQIAEKVQNSSKKGKGKGHVKRRPMTGQKVIAKMDEDGLYYPGFHMFLFASKCKLYFHYCRFLISCFCITCKRYN